MIRSYDLIDLAIISRMYKSIMEKQKRVFYTQILARARELPAPVTAEEFQRLIGGISEEYARAILIRTDKLKEKDDDARDR